MDKPALYSWLAASTVLFTQISDAQSLRGITRINDSNIRLPALTITGVTLSTTADGGLIETTTGLERQRVEIPTSSNTRTIIETYAGTAVNEVTLFDPGTYSNLTPGTSVNAQDPAETFPFICGAAQPGQAANVPGTSTAGQPTGPGAPPRNYAGEDVSNVSVGNPSPNPLASSVISANTIFARQPYLSSGSFGNALPNTAPLQITPFPAGIPYPDCGG